MFVWSEPERDLILIPRAGCMPRTRKKAEPGRGGVLAFANSKAERRKIFFLFPVTWVVPLPVASIQSVAKKSVAHHHHAHACE